MSEDRICRNFEGRQFEVEIIGAESERGFATLVAVMAFFVTIVGGCVALWSDRLSDRGLNMPIFVGVLPGLCVFAYAWRIWKTNPTKAVLTIKQNSVECAIREKQGGAKARSVDWTKLNKPKRTDVGIVLSSGRGRTIKRRWLIPLDQFAGDDEIGAFTKFVEEARG